MSVTLVAGEDRVTVDIDRGARLVSLFAGGRERMLGPGPGAVAAETTWGSFLMAPWAGRMSDARLTWEDRTHQLERNLPPHAIHGVVFDERWSIEELAEHRVVCSCALDPARWPFGGRVRQTIEIETERLSLNATVTGGDVSMPAALGWHPWFQRNDDERVRVAVAGERVLETRTDLIPTGRLAPVHGETDLREGPELGPRRLDHVYVDVSSPACVTWPDLQLTMRFEPPLSTVVVHTPATGFCVEPQTAWPDALRLKDAGIQETGLMSLPPRGELSARTEWSWEPQ